MGTDLYFNKQQAIDAGLKFSVAGPRGTAQQIQDAECTGDASYVEFLCQCPEVLKVPNAEHYVEVDSLDKLAVVRANPWGPTYAPLTQFLNEHHITWMEDC